MRDTDIDQILSGERNIVPSSGFVFSVMETLRREAAVPPPFPLPWKRALPGFIASALALLALVGIFANQFTRSASVSAQMLTAVARASVVYGVPWTALAVLLSAATTIAAMRLAAGRADKSTFLG